MSSLPAKRAADTWADGDKKRIKLDANKPSTCCITNFFTDAECSGFEKLSKLFADGKLMEVQVGELLEHYLILFPNFFQFLDQSVQDDQTKFQNEVVALFESSCAPFSDLISKITIYSSTSTIRIVCDVLLREFLNRACPHAVVEFVANAVSAKKTQCRFLPSAEQCAILLEYVFADLTTNKSHAAFIERFVRDASNVGYKPPRGMAISSSGLKREPSPAADSDEIPEIVEKYLKTLAAVLMDDQSLSVERNDRQTIDSVQAKITALKSTLQGHPPNDRIALKLIIRSIQRRFPGFSCSYHSTAAQILPPVLRESVGGYSTVEPSLFIGSRRQLLRPIELLTVAEVDDILHRTLTDLHQLVLTNSSGSGYTTPAGQSKLRSPTGEFILAIISNLLSEAKEKPHVMARQLPLLSNCISGILQRPIRQLRDAPFCFRYLEFGLDVVLCTAPEAFEDVKTINFFLQSFLQFFENLGKPNRNWWDIVEKTALALHLFAGRRPTEASQLMNAHLPFVRQMTKRHMDKKPVEMGQLMSFLKNIERRSNRQ